MELQHKQADGLGDEDHPPHQQGGDGEITEFIECVFFNWTVLKVHKTLGAGAVAATEWFSRYTGPCWIKKENMLSPISSQTFETWTLTLSWKCMDEYLWPRSSENSQERELLLCSSMDCKSIAEINSVLIRNIRSWRGCGCQSKAGNYQIMHRSVLLSSTYVLY